MNYRNLIVLDPPRTRLAIFHPLVIHVTLIIDSLVRDSADTLFRLKTSLT